jgi:hypothetical protein
MFDTVVFLGQQLSCPAGHSLGAFQTKSFPDPSMSTYLIEGGRVVHAVRGPWGDEDKGSAWRISGDEAIHESRHTLEPVSPQAEVRIYSDCAECEPVLIRVDPARSWGDIVHERRLSVDFCLRFLDEQSMQIERVTGDRQDLLEELQRTGERVLQDDDPLAVAHREIKRARSESTG